MKINWIKVFSFLLFLVVVLLSITVFFLFKYIQEFEPEVYYNVPAERSFIYSEKELKEFGLQDYIEERVVLERRRLIKEERDFIDLNLETMNLILYEKGEIIDSFTVKSKGKEGTWWQTIPGVYFVGDKLVSHFSSISEVWMPYAVQFYGNFFIHGWPYDELGRELLPGPSGGCIRLKSEDAKKVFDFTERGMPVLVFERKKRLPLPSFKMINYNPLQVETESFLVADLETGEIIASKEMNSQVQGEFLTKAMLALVLSEVTSLEKRIVAREWMKEGIDEGIIVSNRRYRAHDLLYPLLRKSSNEAAMVLSRFFTPDYFLNLMNVKARAIGMNNTSFEDITGLSEKNITTLYDAARLARYIKDYRSLIFSASVPNDNFLDKDNLVGAFVDHQSAFSIWQIEKERTVFIGLTNSPDVERETKEVLIWLNRNFDK